MLKPSSLPYTVSAVILAAGRGSRMHSDFPKVIHPLAGKSLLQHVVDTAQQLPVQHCYLIHGADDESLLRACLGQQLLHWVEQPTPQGTGDALQKVLPHLHGEQVLLVLYGDVPLITRETLQQLLLAKPNGGLSLLTATIGDPTGYGRICRVASQVVGIVEQCDANAQQLQICEVNSGLMVVDVADLCRWLTQVSNQNAAKERYLTEIIALAHAENRPIATCQPNSDWEIRGVNDRQQLAQLERHYQLVQAKRLMRAGLTLLDPHRFDLRGELVHGRDVVIDSNVLLQGRVIIGDRVTVGSGAILRDCTIDNDCSIKPYSLIEGSRVSKGCSIGPFARLRPGNELQENVHIGNFVEMKRCHVAAETKAGHFSYLGDADIGSKVNIGAGTITCNYNGVEKFKTVIGDQAFVGAGSQLVAPVQIGYRATVGAGTTVTQDVASDELLIRRAKSIAIPDWRRPRNSVKKAEKD